MVLKAKILGFIATLLGVKILVDLYAGNPSGGMAVAAQFLGLPDVAATFGSFFLAALGLGFGLRALIWNKVCIGDQCAIDSQR
ncbi:MAG: hypothetical protein HWE25_16995 [Alphaproteobacteria bacterium]|nr:hypothetical protein [Alphaproteobacteria bacterium]